MHKQIVSSSLLILIFRKMLQSLNTSYSDLSCMFVKAKKEEKKKGMFEMQAFKHAKWDYLKSKLLKA